MVDPVGANLARFQAAGPSFPNSQGVSGDKDRMEEVSQQFEALFVEQMLSSMRDTLNKDNRLLHGGMGEDYFEDMLYQEYARLMAKRVDFGVAELLQQSFEGP